MPGMTPRRLRLWSDPELLSGFDADSAAAEARRRLRGLRDDIELMHVSQQSPDSIGVVLLVAPSVRGEDIDEIAAVLREALGIGAGVDELLPERAEEVRGIGGEGRTCRSCGAPDGSHVPGCPEEWR
jgi:hypothetical protein